MDEQIKVIIVDDDVEVRKTLVRRLMHSGCTCEEAGDGFEAMEVLEREQCDVALIDLKMPGMGGIELLQQMQSMDLDTVPVILTGYGEVADAVVAMKLGVFEFIEKPATSEIIVSAVHRAARHARAIRQAHQMTELTEQWEAIFANFPDLIKTVDTQLRRLKDSSDDIANVFRKFSELIHYAQSGPVDPQIVKEANELIEDVQLDQLAEELPRSLEYALDTVERMNETIKPMK